MVKTKWFRWRIHIRHLEGRYQVNTEKGNDRSAVNSSLGLILILCLSTIIRLYRLGYYSLWMDEVDTIYGGMLHIPYHPPLFLKLTALWIPYTNSDFALRLLPAVLGILSVFFIWRLTSRVVSPQAAPWAALILASMPIHVYYSRELRMYSAMTMLTIYSWERFFAVVNKGGIYRILGLAVVNAIVIYTHHYGFLFIAGQFAAVLLFRPLKRSILAMTTSTAITGLIYLPWAAKMIFLISRFQGANFWAEKISWKTPLYTWRVLTAGYEPGVKLQLALGLVFLAGVIWSLIKKPGPQLAALLGGGVLIPILGAYTASEIFPSSIFVPRYVLFTTGPLVVVLTAGISAIPRRSFRYIFLSLILILQAISLRYQYNNIFKDGPTREVRPRKNFRGASNYITDRYKPGDVVVTTCESGSAPAWYYITYRKNLPMTHQVDLNGIYYQHLKKKYNMYELVAMYPFVDLVEISDATAHADRIWLYESQWNENVPPEDFYSQHRIRIRNWLSDHFKLVDTQIFYGVEVRLFSRDGP